MHLLAAKRLVESVRRREKQGDCPTEPVLSVETLEDLVITLADQLASVPPASAPAATALMDSLRDCDEKAKDLPTWATDINAAHAAQYDRPAVTPEPETFGSCACGRVPEYARCSHCAADPTLYDSMALEDGEFHWRDGLTFTRLDTGDVRIRRWSEAKAACWTVEPIALIPSPEWDSIVREVSLSPITPRLSVKPEDVKAVAQMLDQQRDAAVTGGRGVMLSWEDAEGYALTLHWTADALLAQATELAALGDVQRAMHTYRRAWEDSKGELAALRARVEELARDRDAFREALAKEWGKTLIPEDTTVRPQSMSYMKPSEFDVCFSLTRAALAPRQTTEGQP